MRQAQCLEARHSRSGATEGGGIDSAPGSSPRNICRLITKPAGISNKK